MPVYMHTSDITVSHLFITDPVMYNTYLVIRKHPVLYKQAVFCSRVDLQLRVFLGSIRRD
jgi:hypothetical protein